ncbi:MAG: cell division protein SepF [Clostridia bacterium]|nr:cell division protein SepF [Clostridia bacterium]
MADLKARLKNFIGFSNTAEDYNVFDDYDDEEEEMVLESDEFDVTTKDQYERVSAKSAETRTTASAGARSTERSGERGKVLNMGMNSSLRVVLSKPTAFSNCEAICSHLRGQMTVVLNLEYVSNAADRKRIFDFVSGCCFALDCTIQRVSDLIYVIAPSHVDVFAEIGDEEENAEKPCTIF